LTGSINLWLLVISGLRGEAGGWPKISSRYTEIWGGASIPNRTPPLEALTTVTTIFPSMISRSFSLRPITNMGNSFVIKATQFPS